MWNDDNHTMWHNIIKGYNMKHMTHQMWYSLTVYGPSIDTLRKLWWWKQELSHLGPCDSGEAKGCSKIQQTTPLNSLALKVYHSPMMPVNKMNLWDETYTKHEHIFRDWHFRDVDLPKFQWHLMTFDWDSTAGWPGTGGGPHPLRCEVDLGWYQRRSSPQGSYQLINQYMGVVPIAVPFGA